MCEPGGAVAASCPSAHLFRVRRRALQQELHGTELGGRGRLDPACTDPPGRVDLVPAVLAVLHPGPDDLDALALVRHRDSRAVLRDQLDDEVAADPGVALSEEPFVAGVESQVDVDVAVVLLENDLADRADDDPATASDPQPLRVVDA